MTDREHKVFTYFCQRNKMYRTYITEAELLKDTKEMLTLLGAVWTRGKVNDQVGVSDLLVCYKGMYYAIELKDDRGTPSVNQIKFLEAVIAAGGKGFISRTLYDTFEQMV